MAGRIYPLRSGLFDTFHEAFLQTSSSGHRKAWRRSEFEDSMTLSSSDFLDEGDTGSSAQTRVRQASLSLRSQSQSSARVDGYVVAQIRYGADLLIRELRSL